MDTIVARFQVRALHSEIGVTLWRVWDSRACAFVAYFTREALASLCAARMNRADRVGSADPVEAGTW